jgi:hypothetical protein
MELLYPSPYLSHDTRLGESVASVRRFPGSFPSDGDGNAICCAGALAAGLFSDAALII